MKKILLALAVVLAVPIASLAATYQYVDNGGALRSVQADNADQAMVAATDRAPNSGVMLYSGTAMTTPSIPGGVPGKYHYVDNNNIVQSVMASSPEAALAAAVNIAPHSGVTLDTGVLDDGTSVNQQ